MSELGFSEGTADDTEVMKREVRKRTQEELEEEYSLGELLPGWFFRADETSAGCYLVEAVDRLGRSVVFRSSDPDAALEECKRRARTIQDRGGSGR